MKVELFKEHEDGSATYTFEMNESERIAIMQAGMLAIIKEGISDIKKYQDEYLLDDKV